MNAIPGDIEVGTTASGTQSIDRSIAVLKIVAAECDGGVALGDVMGRSGLNKPTARRLLLALMRGGLVEQDPATRRYHLGPESHVVGLMAARRFGLDRLALPGLARLAQESGDTAFFSVRRDGETVCLHREEGPFPIRSHVLAAGARHPLGVGAAGIAFLAALPAGEREAVMTRSEAAMAKTYPMLPPHVLRERVAAVRESGYALNPGLVVSDSWGIAVTVRDASREAVAALSIAAIRSRMEPARQVELAVLLTREAGLLEEKLLEFTQFRNGRAQADGANARRRTPASNRDGKR